MGRESHHEAHERHEKEVLHSPSADKIILLSIILLKISRAQEFWTGYSGKCTDVLTFSENWILG
jgi:hypothetical protein